MGRKKFAPSYAICALVLAIFLCVGAQAITCPLPTTVGVVICTPDNEDTVASPVEISAAGKGRVQLTVWKVYVDGSVLWTSDRFLDSIDPTLPMAAGQHRVTVKVWDVNGSTYSKTIFITATTTTTQCKSTVERTVVICSAFVRNVINAGRQIAVRAAVKDQRPITAVILYVNGSKVGNCSLQTSDNTYHCGGPTSATGRTRVTVQARDALGSFSATRFVFAP